jgi:hypothetical protein
MLATKLGDYEKVFSGHKSVVAVVVCNTKDRGAGRNTFVAY